MDIDLVRQLLRHRAASVHSSVRQAQNEPSDISRHITVERFPEGKAKAQLLGIGELDTTGFPRRVQCSR